MALAALLVSLLAVGAAMIAAGFAGRSATAAERSERRTAEANANNLGPSVKITTLASDDRGRFTLRVADHLDAPITIDQIGPTRHWPNFRNVARNELEVFQKYVVPANEDVGVFCCVPVLLQNEGTRSATVHINAPLVGLPGLPAEAPIEGGEIVIEPSTECSVVVYAGLTVGQWFKHECPTGAMSFTYDIEANVEPDGAVQRWSMEVTAPIFDKVHGEASAARVVSHTLPTVSIGQLTRRYPPTSAEGAWSRLPLPFRFFARFKKSPTNL